MAKKESKPLSMKGRWKIDDEQKKKPTFVVIKKPKKK